MLPQSPASPESDTRSIVDRLSYGPGEGIFTQGDDADAVFLVQEGQVKLATVSTSGREGIIALVPAGEFFGESCLNGSRVRPYSAVATTETVVGRIDRRQMEAMIANRSALGDRFIGHVLARKGALEKRLAHHLFDASETRLAHALLELASVARDRALIAPKPGHETLAALVGTTRPRITRFMKHFRERGLVTCHHNAIEVHESLKAFARSGRELCGRPTIAGSN